MYFAVVDPHGPLYRYLSTANRKGYRTLVLACDAEVCRRQESHHGPEAGAYGATSHIDELVECDVASAASIVRALEPYRKQLGGLLPGNETSVAAALEAGAMLGFDCARQEDAACQQVKTAMKQRLLERGVPTPRFRVARTLAEAERAWQAFGGDCMVKMVDYRSSANVYRVTSKSQLRHAWDAIITNKMSLQVPFNLATVAIVEQPVFGRELSVEGYESMGDIVFLNFCEKVTSSRFIVTDHFVPAELSPAEQVSIKATASACVRALGIRNSVFHIELHLAGGEPYVIECASRPPGSAAVLDAIEWAHGYDLIDINIDLSAGRPVTARYTAPKGYYALLAIYSDTSGVLTGLKGLNELRRRGGVCRWHLTARLGDRVEALTDFRHQYGFVILEDDTAESLRKKAMWARRNLSLIVTAGNSEDSGNALIGAGP